MNALLRLLLALSVLASSACVDARRSRGDDDDATSDDDDSGDDDETAPDDDDSGDDDDTGADDDDSGDDDDDTTGDDDDSTIGDDDDTTLGDDDDDDSVPATCTGADALYNGDFEQGTGVGWTASSTQGATIITQFGGATPYSGSWLAELGQYSSEQSFLSQDVTLPSWLTWVDLFFRYRIDTNESSIIAYDTGELVIIDPGSGAVLDVAESWDNGDDTNGFWLQRIIDLRDYRGTTIRLQWQWDNDSSASTSLFIDLVNLTCS